MGESKKEFVENNINREPTNLTKQFSTVNPSRRCADKNVSKI